MASTFSVRNFSEFQHYKDRSPPWIKFHNAVLDNYELGALPDASKAHLFAIWLLASRYDNKIPADAEWVARRINATEPVDLALLAKSGFIELDQGCSETLALRKQDACLEREERERREEGDRGADAQTPMAFSGRVIRLKREDYDAWRKTYRHVPDFDAELKAADDYYAENPPKDGKWFFPVSNWLKRAHEQNKPKPRLGL